MRVTHARGASSAGAMFWAMSPATATPAGEAARACAYLFEISPEMRGCAILTAEGDLLAASGSEDGWEEAARELTEATDAAGPEPASHAHISTVDGEVFLVRSEGIVAIAVAERLTLPSLVLFDLRTTLRDLAKGSAPR